eukprot:gene27241-biopygen17769
MEDARVCSCCHVKSIRDKESGPMEDAR